MSYPATTHMQETFFNCPHFSDLVRIETRVTYPCDLFAEQPQRIMDRTCSDEFNCVLLDKSACPMHLQQIRTQLLN